MLSLSLLFWLTFFAALITLWWQSDKVKVFALNHVQLHCRQLGLQLLDQTMVLKGLWPQRSAEGSVALRRRYQFEFTVSGQTRHKGELLMLGNRVHSLQLEPHPMPEQQESQH